jgi:hypothetical protein
MTEYFRCNLRGLPAVGRLSTMYQVGSEIRAEKQETRLYICGTTKFV